MNISQNRFDVVVIGGGMVGAAAALGLAQAGFITALVEAQLPEPVELQSPPDLRVSAIGCSSVALLKQLDVWPGLTQARLAPYRKLETWEWEAACVVFDANMLQLPELGFMVENRLLQWALWQQCVNQGLLMTFCPDQINELQRGGKDWSLTLSSGKKLQARLIIGADGAHSRVRQLAGIGIAGWQYRQSCLLITVQTQQFEQDVTWQQFYPSGPRAFLPLFENWASLAWYDTAQRIHQLQTMPMVQLEQQITQAFPARLAKVKPVASGAFPLVRRHAQRYILPGLALLGDAAHTIHPLAGQGVNLGYRDVDALLNVLIQARDMGEDFAGERVLHRYQQSRYRDNLLMQSGMDLFYGAFRQRFAAARVMRNLTLMAIARTDKLKQQILKYALGL